MSIFGPVLVGDTVERALVDTIRVWSTTYLAWVEREMQLPARTLPPIKTFVAWGDEDAFPEKLDLPAVVVEWSGSVENPQARGDGSYGADLPMFINVFVGARDERSTRRVAAVYAAALRQLVMQKRPQVPGVGQRTWLGDDASPIPAEDAASVGGATSTWLVHVDNIATSDGGPMGATPDAGVDPYARNPSVYDSWPTVVEDGATLTVTRT